MNKLIVLFFLIVVTNVYKVVDAKLPEYPECGVHNDDETTEFPWTAHLVYAKPGKKNGAHCHGTLISKRVVLTSAHCISKIPSSWTLTHVKLGGISSTNDVAITESILNDNYETASKDQSNDIALLKLEKDVEFTDKIQPLCLPIDARDRNEDLSSKTLEISEYGRTTTADTVKVYEVSKNDCKVFYDNKFNIVDSQICAGAEEPRHSCRGNGGTALMKYGTSANSNTPHYMMVGVSSFGPKNCGTKAEPDVYTRVSAFMEWIVSKMN